MFKHSKQRPKGLWPQDSYVTTPAFTLSSGTDLLVLANSPPFFFWQSSTHFSFGDLPITYPWPMGFGLDCRSLTATLPTSGTSPDEKKQVRVCHSRGTVTCPGSGPVFDIREKEGLRPCGMSLQDVAWGLDELSQDHSWAWVGGEPHLRRKSIFWPNETWTLEKKRRFPAIVLDHLIMPCPKPVLPVDFIANDGINFPYLLKPFWSVFLITHRVQVESPSITNIKGPTSRKSSCSYDSFKSRCLYQPTIKKYHGEQKTKTQWGSRISFQNQEFTW